MRKRLKIYVPHFDNSDLIKGYSNTLIGRCMNPAEQDIKALIVTYPKIWNLVDKVVGLDLGLGRFQFDFDHEEDIEAVLQMQPYYFDYWMVSLVRWQPKKTLNYPSDITFWVKVQGVPLEFWAVPTFESIGNALGDTVEVDHDYRRVKVVVDGFKELCFETTVDFKGGEFHDGEEVLVSLKYEKLFGYCTICGSLCHEEELCPMNTKTPDERSQEKKKKKENRDRDDGKYDDPARSYKGVVIKGNTDVQDKEREKREYYGKGKGKMNEELESRWTKVSDRGSKRYNGFNGNKGHYRGMEEGSRHRSRRWEPARVYTHEERHPLGGRRERSPRVVIREDAREEGEVQAKHPGEAQLDQSMPSAAFQLDLAKTQAEPTEVNLAIVDVDASLDLANEAL